MEWIWHLCMAGDGEALVLAASYVINALVPDDHAWGVTNGFLSILLCVISLQPLASTGFAECYTSHEADIHGGLPVSCIASPRTP